MSSASAKVNQPEGLCGTIDVCRRKALLVLCLSSIAQTLRVLKEKTTQQINLLGYWHRTNLVWENQSTVQESWSLCGNDGSLHHMGSCCCVFS